MKSLSKTFAAFTIGLCAVMPIMADAAAVDDSEYQGVVGNEVKALLESNNTLDVAKRDLLTPDTILGGANSCENISMNVSDYDAVYGEYAVLSLSCDAIGALDQRIVSLFNDRSQEDIDKNNVRISKLLEGINITVTKDMNIAASCVGLEQAYFYYPKEDLMALPSMKTAHNICNALLFDRPAFSKPVR